MRRLVTLAPRSSIEIRLDLFWCPGALSASVSPAHRTNLANRQPVAWFYPVIAPAIMAKHHPPPFVPTFPLSVRFMRTPRASRMPGMALFLVSGAGRAIGRSRNAQALARAALRASDVAA